VGLTPAAFARVDRHADRNHSKYASRHSYRQAMDAASLASTTARRILAERGGPSTRPVEPVTPVVVRRKPAPAPAITTPKPVTPPPAPPTPVGQPGTKPVQAPPTGPGAAPANCGGPIRITKGGTYSGCYQSTSTGTAAVTVATTEPVEIDHATIRHTGAGITEGVLGTRVTLTRSKLTALAPPRPVKQRAVELTGPASFVAERNLLIDGMGIWLGSSSDRTINISPLRVRFNDTVDVGRYRDPTCCVQFFQLDSVAAGADIGWNRVTNTSGRSNIEDNINMYQSGGAGPSAIVNIHDNLIDGAYDLGNSGSGYTGGGIMVGDSGGNYTTVRNNRVVSTSNYGVAIVGGHDNHLIGNRMVNDGRDNSGTPHGPGYAVGIPVWGDRTGPNDSAVGNTIAWKKPDGARNDTWIVAPGTTNSGNVKVAGSVTATTEQAEARAWAVEAAANGLTIGPGW
jgi:hypothetical protein